MPKSVGSDPVSRKKEVVVIVIPFCSPDPQGPNYERYCRQKLMLHQPFRHLDELLGGLETHSQAYSAFLQSSTVPPSLADDIHRLEAAQRVDREDNEVNAFVAALNDCTIIIFIIIIRTQEQDQDETEESDGHRIDDWMLICQHNAEFGQATGEEEDCDWSLAARAYPELREMPSYIAQQRQEFVAQSALTTTAHASHLQGKQLQAYTAVRDHSESSDPNRPRSSQDGCVWHSRNGQVLPHTVPETPAEGPSLCSCSNWSGCLQRGWVHSTLTAEFTCQGRLQAS